jgi:hypothetical protein
MVYFQTKKNWGKFRRALDSKIYFMSIWNILRTFGTFCVDLVHFCDFGTMYQEKSGNPDGRKLNLLALVPQTLRYALRNKVFSLSVV